MPPKPFTQAGGERGTNVGQLPYPRSWVVMPANSSGERPLEEEGCLQRLKEPQFIEVVSKCAQNTAARRVERVVGAMKNPHWVAAYSLL